MLGCTVLAQCEASACVPHFQVPLKATGYCAQSPQRRALAARRVLPASPRYSLIVNNAWVTSPLVESRRKPMGLGRVNKCRMGSWHASDLGFQSASCSLLVLEIQMLLSDKQKNPARPWSYRPQIKWALELA